MNIYFINKRSTLKGPFDITDANRCKLINIGDICVRESVQSIEVFLVVNACNSWQSCKRLGMVSGRLTAENCSTNLLSLKGNTLLFTFNGISRRSGNREVLDNLRTMFKGHLLEKLFDNAIQILVYECDFWDITTYYSMLLTEDAVCSTLRAVSQVAPSKDSVTIFASYLDEKSDGLFQQLLAEGKSLKESYQAIRKSYPKEFRKAMKAFLSEHPNATIYDF